MANSKKLISYTGSSALVAVPTAVDSVLVRRIDNNVFTSSTHTVEIDTYANDISGAPWGAENVVWLKEPSCTISFDANGGTGSMDPRQANIGIAYRIPDCGFSGGKFDYWTIESATGTRVNAGEYYAFSKNTTLYAHWKASPLTFTANQAGSTISMKYNGSPTIDPTFLYSTDGENWDGFYPRLTVITLSNVGDKVYLRGNNPNGINESYKIYYYFTMSGSISASGNIMSLIDNGACTCTTVPTKYCFGKLFYDCTALVTAPLLPATTLSELCYGEMFHNTSIVIAPKLPATNLTRWCYSYMFDYCPALTTVPELPATTLADGCYSGMFSRCSALIISDSSGSGYSNAWRVPTAGTFSNSFSFYAMFEGCATGSGRSSISMDAVAGQSKTYYTLNVPV